MARRPSLPEPIGRTNPPYHLPEPGWYLVLCDLHLPFHDKNVLQVATTEAKKLKVKGVLLNGDVLDSHEISRFDRSPDDHRYRTEIDLGRKLLEWLRHQFPKAHLIWKSGNHDCRLDKYLITRAPALFGLSCLSLEYLLDFQKYGVDFVHDLTVVRAGGLTIIHGHEYRGATQAASPAMALFRKSKSHALMGHHHQSAEHHEPTLDGRTQSAYSVGCACKLDPDYMPLNRWSAGYALVHFCRDGSFSVINRRLVNGRAV